MAYEDVSVVTDERITPTVNEVIEIGQRGIKTEEFSID